MHGNAVICRKMHKKMRQLFAAHESFDEIFVVGIALKLGNAQLYFIDALVIQHRCKNELFSVYKLRHFGYLLRGTGKIAAA